MILSLSGRLDYQPLFGKMKIEPTCLVAITFSPMIYYYDNNKEKNFEIDKRLILRHLDQLLKTQQ